MPTLQRSLVEPPAAVERATTGSSTGSLPGVAHQGLSGRALLAHHAATEAAGDAMMGGGGLGAGAREALLPRCSEASSERRSGTWRPPGSSRAPIGRRRRACER